MRTVRIGTRGSALALWQARHVAGRLQTAMPNLLVELIEITSTGDHITDIPLAEVEGTGFFTASIERALVDGRVDVAVHSYKDLPVAHTRGLVVAAVPSRGPVEDVLCARDARTLDQLPAGSRVGTCSARRTAQIRARRPDLDIQTLRGNVPTRVDRVVSGELDAIVLARAGLVRLGMERYISEVFPVDVMLPAPAQGALALQCRASDIEVVHLLAALDERATRVAVEAERTLLHALGGGCSVPVGAAAALSGDEIVLNAGVFALDGASAQRVETRAADPDTVGRRAARELLELGAGETLAAFGKVTRLEPLDVLNAGTRRR